MRIRPRWQEQGQEPDYRFSLANERTFLAWMRTSLAVLAGAVAVIFVPDFRGSHSRWVLGIGLAALGMCAASYSYLRWAANERAMREGRPLASGFGMLAVTLGIVTIAALVIVLAVVDAA